MSNFNPGQTPPPLQGGHGGFNPQQEGGLPPQQNFGGGQQPSGGNNNKLFIIGAAVVAVLLIVGLGVIFVFSSMNKSGDDTGNAPIITQEPTDPGTGSEEPTEEPSTDGTVTGTPSSGSEADQIFDAAVEILAPVTFTTDEMRTIAQETCSRIDSGVSPDDFQAWLFGLEGPYEAAFAADAGVRVYCPSNEDRLHELLES